MRRPLIKTYLNKLTEVLEAYQRLDAYCMALEREMKDLKSYAKDLEARAK